MRVPSTKVVEPYDFALSPPSPLRLPHSLPKTLMPQTLMAMTLYEVMEHKVGPRDKYNRLPHERDKRQFPLAMTLIDLETLFQL